MAELDLGMNLYDFNKQAMKTFKPLDRIALGMKVEEIKKDIFARPNLKYWMLLNNEDRDYTVFNFLNRDNWKQFIYDFIDTLDNRGDVLDIEKQDNGSYEIWIRYNDNEEPVVYYFFDYTFGVVEI